MVNKSKPKYQIGQVIHHKRFNYCGVILGVDPEFNSTDEWYEMMAKSRPPKDQPWYHVAVQGGRGFTYVAERNLEPEASLSN